MLATRMFVFLSAFILGTVAVSARAETIQVTITNLVFSPAKVSGKVGDTIEWINNDIVAHTATARSGEWDVLIPSKKTTKQVLNKAGTYEFYCRFHPNMKGSLSIQ